MTAAISKSLSNCDTKDTIMAASGDNNKRILTMCSHCDSALMDLDLSWLYSIHYERVCRKCSKRLNCRL